MPSAAVEQIRGFNPIQYEIINMMSCLREESDYVELKSVLVKFLDERLQHAIDHLYEMGDLSEDKMEALSHQHLRTPYRTRA